MILNELFCVAGSGPIDMVLTGDLPKRKHYLACMKAMLANLNQNLAVHPNLMVLSDARPGYGYWWAHAAWSQQIPFGVLAEDYQSLSRLWCAYDDSTNMLDYLLGLASIVDFDSRYKTFGVAEHMLKWAAGFVMYDCSDPQTRWFLDRVRAQSRPHKIVGRSCE